MDWPTVKFDSFLHQLVKQVMQCIPWTSKMIDVTIFRLMSTDVDQITTI